MALFNDWCDCNREGNRRKRLWKFTEKADGRESIQSDLCQTVRSHYDSLDRIAEDVRLLGYRDAAALLRERLPRTAKARSGDLGEILASELVEEQLGLRVPVRRMRYKDGREVPMRGDDFIGIGYDGEENLRLLKGEAKSRKTLAKTTITSARKALSRDNGRPTPSSLLFVADRLLEGDPADAKLGRMLRNEVVRRALPSTHIEHVLFTLSGNAPPASLAADLAEADAKRTHTVINLRIEDHQDFLAEIYEGASVLGDD